MIEFIYPDGSRSHLAATGTELRVLEHLTELRKAVDIAITRGDAVGAYIYARMAARVAREGHDV